MRTGPPVEMGALNAAVQHHLLHEGLLDAATAFNREAGFPTAPDLSQRLQTVFEARQALGQRDLGPALRWVDENQAALDGIGSPLEFYLHRLAFLGFLSQGATLEAIGYARRTLPRFHHSHMKEIRQLMGSIVYARPAEAVGASGGGGGRGGCDGDDDDAMNGGGSSSSSSSGSSRSGGGNIGDGQKTRTRSEDTMSSPYADELQGSGEDKLWVEAGQVLWRDACQILEMPLSCPLSVAAKAGQAAMPVLAKLRLLLRAQGKDEPWWSEDELPVEIDLGDKFSYHSVFACPVSRDQATPHNPPVLLACGHAICHDSMAKISRHRKRFKCPTCPMQQTPEETVRLLL